MARTTETEVRDVFSAHADGTALDTAAVDFYIAAANDLVNEYLSGAGIASNTLQRIEALLACHMLAAADPTEVQFSEGDTSGTFESPDTIPEGLGETRHGRRALALDPTGNLSRMPTGDVSKAEFFGPT